MNDDSNMLSQEDIDALMAGDGEGGGDEAESGAEEGRLEPADLQSPLEMILKQAGTVLTTVLNKGTELTVKVIKRAKADNVWGAGNQFMSQSLFVKAPFINGIEGELFYVVSQGCTALLADLMMMGDGSAEYEEDHKDALSELGNQIMGAVCTAMGGEFGISINCAQTEVGEYTEGGLPFEPDGSFIAEVSLKIEDFEDYEILMVLTPALSQSLSAYYHTEPEPEPEDSNLETSLAAPEGTTDLMGRGRGRQDERAVFASTGNVNIDMLLDVPLDITIELGRSVMSIRRILDLGPGAIVELDRKASEPVDLMVGDKVVAKGEVVVVDEFFGIRIVSLVSPEERIKHLK